MRARFLSEELKSGFFGEMQQVFDEAIVLVVGSGDAEDALEVSERSRGRALQDLLRGRVQTKSGGEVLTEALAQKVSIAEISTVRHFLAGPGTALRRALALGNADLGSTRLALPASEREVEQIRTAFPEAEVYVRQAATKQQLLRRAPASEVIHIAAHADLDEVDPLYSAIRLVGGDGKPGDLEAHEVYEMDLSRARLVTLSACNTGLGQVSCGDELWGFTRSFLAAGSRSLLVSLWPVEDEATGRLMARFYENLGKDGVRGALRRAQLQLLAAPPRAILSSGPHSRRSAIGAETNRKGRLFPLRRQRQPPRSRPRRPPADPSDADTPRYLAVSRRRQRSSESVQPGTFNHERA